MRKAADKAAAEEKAAKEIEAQKPPPPAPKLSAPAAPEVKVSFAIFMHFLLLTTSLKYTHKDSWVQSSRI